jgi:hypothetical protein
MTKTHEGSVLLGTHMPCIGQTFRMALRGAGVRNLQPATNTSQMMVAFNPAPPNVLMIYIDSAAQDDPGVLIPHFARRSATSPDRAVPAVAVSQGQGLATIEAAGNGGAHRCALFPAWGEQFLKTGACGTSVEPTAC